MDNVFQVNFTNSIFTLKEKYVKIIQNKKKNVLFLLKQFRVTPYTSTR